MSANLRSNATIPVERDVIEAFHLLARQSLAKARSDGLIDASYVESSTEEELQILGPAREPRAPARKHLRNNGIDASSPDGLTCLRTWSQVCLFFAGLESITDPASVTVPPTNSSEREFVLSVTSCPATMLGLFRLWQKAVPILQSLSIDQQADVARLLCDLEPQTSPITTQMVKIAADLSSIAIAIAQRKTYLERYASDLEDLMGRRPPAPPQYTPPQSSLQQVYGQDNKEQEEAHPRRRPLPIPPADELAPSTLYRVNSTASTSTQATVMDEPDIPMTDDPELETVRQTFYAVLAEIITDAPRLAIMLREDPARGIYTSETIGRKMHLAHDCVTDEQEPQPQALHWPSCWRHRGA